MDFPFEIPERTEFSDDGYGILGRAIAFATDFEGNCRAFATLIGLKSEPEILRDQKTIDEFCKFIERRRLSTNLRTIEEKLRLPEEVATVLIKGREARNYLAHEAGLALKNILEIDDRRQDFVNNVKSKVRDLAEANLVVVFISNLATNEPNPTANYLKQ